MSGGGKGQSSADTGGPRSPTEHQEGVSARLGTMSEGRNCSGHHLPRALRGEPSARAVPSREPRRVKCPKLREEGARGPPQPGRRRGGGGGRRGRCQTPVGPAVVLAPCRRTRGGKGRSSADARGLRMRTKQSAEGSSLEGWLQHQPERGRRRPARARSAPARPESLRQGRRSPGEAAACEDAGRPRRGGFVA